MVLPVLMNSLQVGHTALRMASIRGTWEDYDPKESMVAVRGDVRKEEEKN